MPLTAEIGKKVTLPKLFFLKYSINFFASCSVSVTTFWRLAPKLISIATSYSFFTFNRFATTSCNPFLSSGFISADLSNDLTLFV